MGLKEFTQSSKNDVMSLLIACITLYGYEGIPLKKLNEEFRIYTGKNIPYDKFGFKTLKAFLYSMPRFTIRIGDNNEVIVHADSEKSTHMRELVANQKMQVPKRRSYPDTYQPEAKEHNLPFRAVKRPRVVEAVPYMKKSVEPVVVETVSEKLTGFKKLETMLPLFYNNQALGDDFFLDIADTKMGCYVPKNGPKECGLCAVGQTIAQLKEKVVLAEIIAPRVVVMIGFNDLLMGRSATNMILDMRDLIIELKKRNTMISLVTLIQSPKLPKTNQTSLRMEIFNKALLEYANESQLQCNVIDMNATLSNEAKNFRKDL